MKRTLNTIANSIFCLFLLSGCNTNHPTGSPTSTLIGAGVGAGSVALLGGSKTAILFGGLGGGAIGYYVSTLRYDSGGVMLGGGQVYTLGNFVAINIPSDNLFEPNSAEFLPQADSILDSVATILQRYPDNNILISGNTSGFGQAKWERRLSEKRAQRVSAYLWNAGINNFKEGSNNTRRLNYVGYGDSLPIANHYSNESIRQNSHIQITSYPSTCDLHLNKVDQASNNIGAMKDADISDRRQCYNNEC
jgi:hypothetical protein